MTSFLLSAASAFSPLSRPQHRRSHRARVALSTTHDETLRANAAKWVSSPEIKKLLRQSREGTLWDDADEDDEHGSVASLWADDDDAEIASPGRTAPAHARPLEEAPAETIAFPGSAAADPDSEPVDTSLLSSSSRFTPQSLTAKASRV